MGENENQLAAIAVTLQHIDEKTDRLEKYLENMKAQISDIQTENVKNQTNFGVLKAQFDKIEQKAEKTKDGIYTKMECLETEFRASMSQSRQTMYEYIRREDEKLEKRITEELKEDSDKTVNRVKLWFFSGALTFAGVIIMEILRVTVLKK